MKQILENDDLISKKIIASTKHYLNSSQFDQLIKPMIKPLIQKHVEIYLKDPAIQQEIMNIVKKKVNQALRKTSISFG